MRVFLSGYYGFKNLGDELLLYKVIKDIEKIFPSTLFLIWTSDPSFTEDFLKEFNIKGIYRFNIEETVSAVKNSDVVVLGGGGLIQQYYGIRVEDLFRNFGFHIPSYVIPSLLARIFNKKVFYWCLGHGPVATEEGLAFSRWFYSLADVITLRDAFSYQAVKSLLPEKKQIFLDIDPLLEFDFKKYKKEPEKGVLGISLRKWFNDDIFLEKIAQVIKKIAQESSIRILFIPCDLNLDVEIMQKFMKFFPEDILIKKEVNNFDEVLNAIARCDWFVGMRLHSLIAAYKLERPFLALSYDLKTEEFMKEIGGEYIKITDFSETEFFSKLKQLLNSEPLTLKNFQYKTPEIFSLFIKEENLEISENKSLNFSSNFETSERVYLKDFVKTLFLQREELYRRLEELTWECKNLKEERDRLKEERM